MRVAAIDCGTNSIRLLIADIENGNLTDVVRTMIIVRLGEGVDKTGEFSQAALTRTFAAIDSYAELISEHKPELVRFVATSASRDVSNRSEFVDGIVTRLGIEPDIIDFAVQNSIAVELVETFTRTPKTSQQIEKFIRKQ